MCSTRRAASPPPASGSAWSEPVPPSPAARPTPTGGCATGWRSRTGGGRVPAGVRHGRVLRGAWRAGVLPRGRSLLRGDRAGPASACTAVVEPVLVHDLPWELADGDRARTQPVRQGGDPPGPG